MDPKTANDLRQILDAFRAQVYLHLPALTDNGQPEATVPLKRLPYVGQIVQQLVESEAVYAQAQSSAAPPDAPAS